jgi:hypothetical protein
MAISIRPIRIEGNIAYVPLTKGYEAIIDAEDAKLIGQWNWHANLGGKNVYARRKVKKCEVDIEGRYMFLHRELLKPGTEIHVDHIDGNGLNNRKENLRLVTSHQNCFNRKINSNSTSGLKGVTWNKKDQRWRAQIRFDGEKIFLGNYKCPNEAYAAYCKASADLHGEFGRIA